jgi:hypothetical protein
MARGEDMVFEFLVLSKSLPREDTNHTPSRKKKEKSEDINHCHHGVAA